MEQPQQEQIHGPGDGRDEGGEAYGVITARHPDTLQLGFSEAR